MLRNLSLYAAFAACMALPLTGAQAQGKSQRSRAEHSVSAEKSERARRETGAVTIQKEARHATELSASSAVTKARQRR